MSGSSLPHEDDGHSPVARSDRLATSLSDLGRVRHLVAPNTLHYRYLPDWGDQFPKARTFEAGGPCRGSAGAGYDDLAGTPGFGHGPETSQSVAEDLAGWIDAALGKIRNRVVVEAGHPAQLQLHRFAIRRGLHGGDERRLARGTSDALAAGTLAAEVGVVRFDTPAPLLTPSVTTELPCARR